MRFATDTGGTFTDLVIEDDKGEVFAYKASTVPSDPVKGVLDVLGIAATDLGLSLRDLLQRGDSFIHGTTHAINAIVTGKSAKTALITTRGHRDLLIMREGGRSGAFDHCISYPNPYVPRALTFEVDERINAAGCVISPLDETSVVTVLQAISETNVDAVAVCLLWSIQNPAHELRVGELLATQLPDVAVTLSHVLNPVIREYRRAASASIDVSLKPMMGKYLGSLAARLEECGYCGPILVLTSKGGMQNAQTVAQAPIQILNSGPSMAPLAGRYYAGLSDSGIDYSSIIVADTGGTTFDVSVIRDGTIPLTHEMWIGRRFQGDITGFPSVDVTSVGAGGGSIAWVDNGGVLHVGPQSAGSDPGPACYQRGGSRATVTDAAVVLGYIDPAFFLNGRMQLDANASRIAIEEDVAGPLQSNCLNAAWAVIALATENMVQAILEITMNQGIDPRQSILIGGGGAAGLNSGFVVRRLGCRLLIFPELGATLSAAGAMMSDLVAEYRNSTFVSSDDFDYVTANNVLDHLQAQCDLFSDENRETCISCSIEFGVEARYANQVFSIDIPLRESRFGSEFGVEQFVEDFHDAHERIYSVRDPLSTIEIVGWTSTIRCSVRNGGLGRLRRQNNMSPTNGRRPVYFAGCGSVEADIYGVIDLNVGEDVPGPAIVETPYTTIVVDPESSFRLTSKGNVELRPGLVR